MIEWGEFGQKAIDFIAGEDARINILEGSVRSGKTVAMIPKWLCYLKEGPPGLLAITGVSKDTIYDNVLRDMFDLAGKQSYSYNRQSGELKLYGRNIKVIGAKDEGSEKYLRGKTLAGAYCDELSLMPERFFKQLLNRLSIKGAKLFGTTNPDSQYHFLFTEFMSDAEKLKSGLVKVVHFELDDNPNLDEDYKRDIKKAYSGLWYKRMIQGLWVVADGAVYDMWDENLHVVDNLPGSFDRTFVGIDYATGNPTAFILVGLSGQNVYVIDEYYWDSKRKGRQKLDSEYSRDLQEFIRGREPDGVMVDPSAASFILQLKRDGVKGIQDAENEVLDGIRNVGTLLTAKRLFIHRRCENLRKEFSSYIWDEKAQLKGEDKPIKQNDHALDALRYVVRTKLKYLCAGPVKQYKTQERKYSPTTGYM
ncbi:MAG TPA: PBSX family phage terminase large subunit [Clostridia bacterium]